MIPPDRACDRLSAGLLVLASVLWVPAGQRPPVSDVEHGVAGVRLLMERGAHAEAEREATSLAARVGLDGDQSVTLASLPVLDVLVAARLHNGKAGERRSLDLAMRATASSERLAGPGSLQAASALRNLGVLRIGRGEFAVALTLHERALEIRARHTEPASAPIADSLERLAHTEILLERFDSARQRLDKALAIREAASATAPLSLAGALELQATWLRYTGEYARGLAALDRARTIRARAAPDFPYATTHQNVRGDLRFLQGDIESARQDWTQGLTLAERTLDPDHPTLALFLRKLALAADAFGHRADARALLARAVAIGARRLPPCHPEAAGLLNDSAISAERDADFTQARTLYQQHLRRLEACHSNANWTATALHNLGNIAMKMGDLTEAERMHDRAVRTWSDGLGPRHPYVARGLDALAEVLAARGQQTRARRLYERALDIRRGSSQREMPDVAWTLTNLASTVAELGNLALASRHVDEALAIYRQHGAFDEPDHLARALALKGTIQSRRGDLTGAQESLTASLEERARIFGPGHPLLAESGAALARAQLLAGMRRAALATAVEAERTGREHLQQTVRYLPERQAMAYAAKRPAALDLLVSLAASKSGVELEAIFDAVIRSRGVILDELARRTRDARADDPRIAAMITEAFRARQRFANLVVRSMQQAVPRQALDDARAEKEAAEQRLARESVEARIEPARDQGGFETIEGRLDPLAALVSFVKYEHESAEAAGLKTGHRQLASYAAFVLTGGRLTHVRLGTAATIEPLVHRWRQEAAGRSIAMNFPVRRAEAAYRQAATRLREVIWDPLQPQLDAATSVLVVPDGLLNLVSLAALPGPQGGYAVEDDRVIHYLSTERDLISPPAGSPSHGLLAVGGVAFGATTKAAGGGSATNRTGCADLNQVRFTNLPGTAGEVSEIGRLWTAQQLKPATMLTGGAATEGAVKRALAGRRVVHLATHGFVLGAECPPEPGTTRAVGGLARLKEGQSAAWDNPLLLSGLAFAGANLPRSSNADQDDGILTAEEVASLDLRGLEWAVLSACDTGLGQIRAGEGVFGLRRAFQIAGARTVIMSLWSVDDQATRDWMRALYEGRLSRQLDTADAVRNASLSILRDRRARGQSTHPFYWAAFVAAGDWR